MTEGAGRVNQKARTRQAIVEAGRGLVRSGAEISMAEVAVAALVSEATAYRYFPDLATLLREAMTGLWPDPAEALAPVAGSADPAERVAFACEVMLRDVIAYQGAVRAMIALTVARPAGENTRPGLRFGLIDHALGPFEDDLPADELARLKRDLALVISADAFLGLIDQSDAGPEEALASAVRVARTLTRAAFERDGRWS